ncbi:family 10 glycosylhydrolase [Oscillatoria sp. FACHB-1407]|uniref:family 10 glycosylhydrolase n=1 Tax=Oscillatoria sp. FACHB-1407 TaxID=2692847 RepID=UPI001682122A|nr:family 10 glycosylhydrolase [Oscillatoria sp. FACHB-1407]MBD2463798.1 family 10 glycosylhydrolase [Oscillatoria sp. FACHB-1407]
MKFLRSFSHLQPSRLQRHLVTALITTSLVSSLGWSKTAQAHTAPYCQLTPAEIAQTDALRQAAIQGDRTAQNRYRELTRQHANTLRQCRRQNWLQTQAIWLRLYPCDVRPGALEEILDNIVSRGYNQVYVEVFANGQVLLPQSDNNTSWVSMIRTPGYSDRDLLAEAIAKGRERGLQVYAWMFTMNFGYTYSQRPGADQVLARNGAGHTSLTFRTDGGANADFGSVNADETFIDPYNVRAKQDYYALVQAIVRRRPDGVLFDYIRYPRGTGAASVASRVSDLWIYGSAAQNALYERALNQSGRELIRRFISRGYITAGDVASIRSLYPQDGEPLWQGLNPNGNTAITPEQAQPYLQQELWRLSVGHAIQGVLDFLSMSILPVQRQGITAGAVFFPDGNLAIGRGYDSRLQPWDRFPNNIEWHPMSYAICGTPDCIVAQVQRVSTQAPGGTKVMPVLAGTWGRAANGRPSLEAQMQAIHQAVPQITSISHFAYSWQFPQADQQRKFCRL